MDLEEFKPFRETYRTITFALRAGMLYPNPRTEKWRLAAIPIAMGSHVPIFITILLDIHRYCKERDVFSVIRVSTLMAPYLAGIFKMVLMYYKRDQAKQIIDRMDEDFSLLNELPQDHKTIAALSIKNSQKYSEKAWTIAVIACGFIFSITAIVLNVYNSTFKFEPTKYMVHDLNKPFAEPEIRFESPYFEVMFVYMVYCALFYVVSFIGYDAFFGLAVNHACMKMELVCKSLEDAMESGMGEVCGRVADVVRDHCRLYEFVNLIQDTFNVWLGLVFIATVFQLCTSLYQITEGYAFDQRYMMFTLGAIIHIYVPCRYAGKLKDTSLETATKFYCCGWERIEDLAARKILCGVRTQF